jgi:uncharacterized protein GlcG (DUF336 family)
LSRWDAEIVDKSSGKWLECLASSYGIHVSNQGHFMIVAGGLPIFFDDQIVGGIGCSSGHADQDEAVSQAGVDAFAQSVKR